MMLYHLTSHFFLTIYLMKKYVDLIRQTVAVYNNEGIRVGHVRHFGVVHQQFMYFLSSHPEQPRIICHSITESGNRKYYWNVIESKDKVSSSIYDERLYYDLLVAANMLLPSDEIEEVF